MVNNVILSIYVFVDFVIYIQVRHRLLMKVPVIEENEKDKFKTILRLIFFTLIQIQKQKKFMIKIN
jgi:hypothetical protein